MLLPDSLFPACPGEWLPSCTAVYLIRSVNTSFQMVSIVNRCHLSYVLPTWVFALYYHNIANRKNPLVLIL